MQRESSDEILQNTPVCLQLGIYVKRLTADTCKRRKISICSKYVLLLRMYNYFNMTPVMEHGMQGLLIFCQREVMGN